MKPSCQRTLDRIIPDDGSAPDDAPSFSTWVPTLFSFLAVLEVVVPHDLI